MLSFLKKKEEFLSPVSGSMLPLEEVNDPVFSQKLMGDGFAILPSDSCIYAPLSGTISAFFPTKHAIGIKTKDGLECLLHIGINTVELKGDGFVSKLTQGQTVKQGDKLIDIDLKLLTSKGYDPTIMVVFPNSSVTLTSHQKKIKAQEPIAVSFTK